MARRPTDWLSLGYTFTGVLNALAALYWMAQDQPLRSAIVGVATPLWLLLGEVRRG